VSPRTGNLQACFRSFTFLSHTIGRSCPIQSFRKVIGTGARRTILYPSHFFLRTLLMKTETRPHRLTQSLRNIVGTGPRCRTNFFLLRPFLLTHFLTSCLPAYITDSRIMVWAGKISNVAVNRLVLVSFPQTGPFTMTFLIICVECDVKVGPRCWSALSFS
jgi:hypothetical protein